MKAIPAGGGKLTRHEEQMLEGLEKEIRAVKKARETLGDKAPTFGRGWHRDDDSGPRVLGKRRRDPEQSSSDEDVPEDVKNIPMPRDTPPMFPRDVMDRWYAERNARRDADNAAKREEEGVTQQKQVAEAKTVYEAKPVIRDLRKEAVSAFVPTAVRMKMDKAKGHGGLLEPQEADRLEQEGYLKTTDDGSQAEAQEALSRNVTMEEVEDDED